MSLSRAYARVLKLLDLSFVPSDPVLFFPTIANELSSLSESDLPVGLINAVAATSVPATLPLAVALTALLSSLGLLSAIPPPAAACAIMILALEGERGEKLPAYQSLASELAKRVSAGRTTVNECYKDWYLALHGLLDKLPWHQPLPIKVKGKNQKGRVDERDAVARSLIDIIKYQEQLQRPEHGVPNALQLVVEDDDDEDGHASEPETVHLLPTKARQSTSTFQKASDAFVAPLQSNPTTHLTDVQAYLLSCSDTDFERQPKARSAPTRLQLLSVSRGGEENVADDELFEAGELDAVLRTEEERALFQRVVAEDWAAHAERASRVRPRGSFPPNIRRTKAIAGWDEGLLDAALEQYELGSTSGGDDDDVVEDWRSSSPTFGPTFDDEAYFED